MKKRSLGIVVSPVVVLSLVLAGFLTSYFMFSENRGHDVAYLQPKSLNEINTKTERQPSKEEVAQKIQTLKMPFIANEGQVDDRVEFYANTLGGTVFVTTHGEIVYALPKRVDEDNGCRGGLPHPYMVQLSARKIVGANGIRPMG